MRGKCLILMIIVLMMIPMGAGNAQSFVFIHEFLADPALGPAGDANNDGTRDSYEDEFVELFNLSSGTVDISGWSIADALAERYSFTAGTLIQPNSAFVVFGGGTPNLPGIDWQVLTSGSLNLNNGGDTIILSDATGSLIDSHTYGSEAGDDQSITRSPEGTRGGWVSHTDLPNADGKLFSPGYLVNDLPPQSTVPEPATVFSILSGLGLILVKKIPGRNT
ncbi:MAG: lamin tail domain-containing protein [Candidatus Omnitrophota bacterium]